MFALHHPRGVLCAHVVHKVNFYKYPPLARLCAGYLSAIYFAQQRNRMQVQELGGLFEFQSFHVTPPANTCGM
jgi:hypothetical protein